MSRSKDFAVDIRGQKILEEAINHERDARLGWYFKNRRRADEIPESRQLEVMRNKIAKNLPRPTAELRQACAEINLKKRAKKFDKFIAENSAYNPPKEIEDYLVYDMKPVEDRSREKLQKDNGRKQYLKERRELMPDSKYYFPLVSSWEYGWHQGEMVKTEDMKKPEYGRSKIIADSFYSRNGAHCS